MTPVRHHEPARQHGKLKLQTQETKTTTGRAHSMMTSYDLGTKQVAKVQLPALGTKEFEAVQHLGAV